MIKIKYPSSFYFHKNVNGKNRLIRIDCSVVLPAYSLLNCYLSFNYVTNRNAFIDTIKRVHNNNCTFKKNNNHNYNKNLLLDFKLLNRFKLYLRLTKSFRSYNPISLFYLYPQRPEIDINSNRAVYVTF